MKKYSLLAGLLIAIASIIAIASAWHDAPIVDEDPHIGAGYSYIAGQTYEFNPEHPPLAKDFAGLALTFLHINPNIIPAVFGNKPLATTNDQWNFGRALIYHSGVDPNTIVHVARLPLILFFIFCGWLVYLWARKTYNPRTGLLAVFLFVFCSTVVAHARFVTTDVPALFGVLLASYFFLKYLKEQSTSNFWLSSITFGIALITKFSTFILIPYFLLLSVAWIWVHHDQFFKPALRLIGKTILIMLIGFVVVVGPVYQLHILNYSAAQQQKDTATILKYSQTTLSNAVIWAADKPLLRPYAQWGLGMAMVFQRAAGGNRTYYLGQLSSTSFKSYFPVVYALKEPIPFLILLLSAIWLGWRAWRSKHLTFKNKLKEHFPAFTMLLWILIYVGASINANLNIGIRHLMPIYGFIFVLVAGQIEASITNQELRIKNGNKNNLILNTKFLILVLLGWYVAEFASVYPYYLTYFNEFAGGPSGGHNYVVDSNLDWGQDLWRLGDFVHNGNGGVGSEEVYGIDKIYVDYFGWAEQSFYLGDAFQWMHAGQFTSKEQFLKENPTGGWLAVSFSYYQESTVDPAKPYAWLGEPTDTIGHSIFVWHIVP